MTVEKPRIIDADGHVAEDSAAIIARMPEAYRDEGEIAAVQSVSALRSFARGASGRHAAGGV